MARQRRILRSFQSAGADSADRARTLAEVGVRETHFVSRLARAGVLVEADGGRYFVSADGLARWTRRRNRAVTTVAILFVLGAILAFLLSRG
jgi:hypothetical protein